MSGSNGWLVGAPEQREEQPASHPPGMQENLISPQSNQKQMHMASSSFKLRAKVEEKRLLDYTLFLQTDASAFASAVFSDYIQRFTKIITSPAQPLTA